MTSLDYFYCKSSLRILNILLKMPQKFLVVANLTLKIQISSISSNLWHVCTCKAVKYSLIYLFIFSFVASTI